MNNLAIISKEAISSDVSIIEIDGSELVTLRSFFEVLAEYMHFPDYFGFNLDSLDELLCDLSWIEDKKLAIYINNSEYFLNKERNETKKTTLLDMLDAICEDWKWIDAEEETERKELNFYFSESENIKKLLNKN